MTVEGKLGFGLKINGVSKDEIKKKTDEANNILKLADYLDRKPAALSGGQRQRVAIGRTIVRGPDIFFLDEPLSNIDAEFRVEIASLHQEIGRSARHQGRNNAFRRYSRHSESAL